MNQPQVDSSATSDLNDSTKSLSSRLPKTIVAPSREELIEPIELNIRNSAGDTVALPDDLQGHFFIVSPVGSPNSSLVSEADSVVWVTKDGWTPIYNGDGMVYRFSFNQGKATLNSRFVKPPCYYADLATGDQNNDHYQDLGFQNLGISRLSINKLGIRNQLNTNFVPFKFLNDQNERLMITWDMGRPYEIDPETLETLNPVGKNSDWDDLIAGQATQPFKQVMSTAHPAFDPKTGELFTLNVGKSIWTTLSLPRSLKERVVENKTSLESIKQKPENSQGISRIFNQIYALFLNFVNFLIKFLKILEKASRIVTGGYDFVHLLAWDGEQVDIKQKWNIVLPGKKHLKIDQTVHQMGITKDYIVFVESSFKFSLDNTLPFLRSYLATSFKILVADFIDYPQYPSTKLYIVKRSDLKLEKTKTGKFLGWFNRSPFKDLPKVVAKEVELAPEFSHYIVDYDNADNRIIVHASHLAATDIAEYIRIFDRSAYDDRDNDVLEDKYDDPELTSRLQDLAGNIVSPMDISRLGYWVIDGEEGKIVNHKLFPDEEDRDTLNQQIVAHYQNPQANPIDIKYLLTWSTAFYVCPDQRPTTKYTDVFWNSWGSWPETLTTRTVEAYKRYSQRLVDWENVIDLTYQGIPSSLSHLKIRTDAEGEIKIELDAENYYQFHNRYLGTSAQFIPRPQAEDQTDGYIACVVLTSDEFLSQSDRHDNDPEWSQNSEIWIFDARKLNEGPLYKLSHPKLNIGFSFHTTWMPEAKSPSKRLDYDVREDYDYLVQELIANQPELSDKIRQLFDEEIYPHFE